MNDKKLLPVKSDIVFRLFFADERDLNDLREFLKSVAELPEDDYDIIEIADSHLLREFEGDKLAVIDVKLRTKTGKIIHIEIQLKITEETKNRIIYYSSNLVTEQIGSGDDYDVIKKVISIVITDEKLIEESPKYHHRFTFYDREAEVELSDLIEIHTIELGKVPDEADGTKLYDWAKFIDAETEEELNMLTQRNPEFESAANKLRLLSADKEARDLYERREKARRDHNMFVRDAERRGLEKGRNEGHVDVARNLIGMNLPLDQIEKATGLPREEIERLQP